MAVIYNLFILHAPAAARNRSVLALGQQCAAPNDSEHAG